MKAILLTAFLFLFSIFSFSQTVLKGLVKDSRDEPIFAANVYLKSNAQLSTSTDLDGKFQLPISSMNDTLIVSFVGYKIKKISLNKRSLSDSLIVVLKGSGYSLAEVIITARNPISEDFSAVHLTKLDIYLNPTSQGDPLKAISFLPSSTTTDESANPSFRGSSIDRTRVFLNGVPIYQPVRNTQINKVGGFSIFNTEVVGNEYAYASNPPLIYGNTSSGLVDITTLTELPHNQLQFSATLASFGIFLSQKIKQNSFTQLFSNYQFSGPFIQVNKPSVANLNEFGMKDAGLNYHAKLSKRVEFNSFNYFITENYDAGTEAYTYVGQSTSSKNRFFSINNLMYYMNNGVLSINTGFDKAKKDFLFGNIISHKKILQTYASANYKHFVSNSMSIQTGLTYDYQSNIFDDLIPLYFYAQSPSSPNYQQTTDINNHNIEAYLYSNWNLTDQWNVFYGLRSNIPTNTQRSYLSSQLGLRYTINNDQSLSLSGGKYNSYSLPDFYHKQFNLLKSNQIALEYTYKHKNTLLKAASFYIDETGQEPTDTPLNISGINTFGAELSYERYLHRYLKITLANTYLNQILTVDGGTYNGDKKFDFFIKASLNYTNPKLFSSSLIYIGRPGSYDTPIIGSTFDTKTSFYNPTFSNDLYSQQAGSYNRFDVNLSRHFEFNKTAITCFMSVNNVLNTQNESGISYNTNYSTGNPYYYQLRTWFFGIMLGLKY